MKNQDQESLKYHSEPRPGKLEVISTKPAHTEKFLSLAYSPGVAAPCKAIAKDPDKVYDYTVKGNLVAVISDGTAVLGLGNIGPLASKPVMEGKGILFKQFADIDVFDIELKTKTVDEFVNAVKTMEPTFGGINLEDIKAPECFEIESRLQKEMNIPVFHDDQHGTAIISGAALINACKLQDKKLSEIKVCVNGAGASAISCSRIFISLGVNPQNILMCDSKGVIYKGRTEGMNAFKDEFAVETPKRTLKEAVHGADVFVGLSVGGALSEEMLMSMNPKGIVFAMANPDPEINPKLAKKLRPDFIIATGRTDYPNQVNNVLGFPFIFRGALDVRATSINEAMKLAAVHALAELARQDVPENVSEAYQGQSFQFGPDYIIPKPFDRRVLLWVAPAVAKAAMDSGVAQKPIADFQDYKNRLESVLGLSKTFVRNVISTVQARCSQDLALRPKIVFADGASLKVLKAIHALHEENLCQSILVGYPDLIEPKLKEIDFFDVEIVHPSRHPLFQEFCDRFYEQRCRRGVSKNEAARLMADPSYFSAMMLKEGLADGLITGAALNYADAVRPLLSTLNRHQGGVAAGFNIIVHPERMLFFADTTMHINPSSEELANIGSQIANVAKRFGIEPRIAMLSYSNFTAKSGTPEKMFEAKNILQEMRPDLVVDGDMQADTAVNPEILSHLFPFSSLVGKGAANILIFPNLEASNIAYKLLQQLAKVEVLGPFLTGFDETVHVLQRTSTSSQIMNTIVMTALQAQDRLIETKRAGTLL